MQGWRLVQGRQAGQFVFVENLLFEFREKFFRYKGKLLFNDKGEFLFKDEWKLLVGQGGEFLLEKNRFVFFGLHAS